MKERFKLDKLRIHKKIAKKLNLTRNYEPKTKVHSIIRYRCTSVISFDKKMFLMDLTYTDSA
ncbi:hypothetical protein SAMN05192551_101185 [Tindallia magadiensis]|uniref:Uncharacterized protein n=1 Tax=Tindallia magadiensis TaxID=69895 RepID=A0A1I3AG28_9FIRM|nr:hypothetical protein SAMN05192551_101185 [Tindallia magadiensis]